MTHVATVSANICKLYHSIHAKGERVEDVLEAFEASQQNTTEKSVEVTQLRGKPTLVAFGEEREGERWEEEAEEGQVLEDAPENAAQVSPPMQVYDLFRLTQ